MEKKAVEKIVGTSNELQEQQVRRFIQKTSITNKGDYNMNSLKTKTETSKKSIINIHYSNIDSQQEKELGEWTHFMDTDLISSTLIIRNARSSVFPEFINLFNKIWKCNVSRHNIVFPNNVKSFVKKFINYLSILKNQVILHFNFNSIDNDKIHAYNPDYPNFENQLEILKLAFNKGFNTSVSCSPLQDENIETLMEAVKPYVTDSISIDNPDNDLLNDDKVTYVVVVNPEYQVTENYDLGILQELNNNFKPKKHTNKEVI